ncbi:DUF885 domain-containing protein [Pseudonocardiaceae bacterium YIM PH 21723]|nr:DUF885 domain-containing protein [Pseudonocardiaceae bacterium YIM PH 21723]
MGDQVLAGLADELNRLDFDRDPVSATLYGVRDRDHLLTEISAEAQQDYLAKAEDIAVRADAIDPSTLDSTDRATRSVIRAMVDADRDHIESHGIEYLISAGFWSPAARLLTSLPLTTLTEPAHAEAYLQRLAAIPVLLGTALQRHRAGIAAGRVPVAHLVQAAIDSLDRYLGHPNSDPLDKPDGGEEHGVRRAKLLADVVRPAFAAYRDGLAQHVLPTGRPAELGGLCHLPEGDALYAKLVRKYTTTDRSPDDLHRTGLDLIDRLAAEYTELGGRLWGITDPGEVIGRLRSDPALRCTDEASVLDHVRASIVRAESVAPAWFNRRPAAPCAVEPVPADLAPNAASAYYYAPSTDGSRPGSYFHNTYKVEDRDAFVLDAIAFHEAVPGHHFQLSLAQELTELPELRRRAFFIAYIEGWALYAERLADEMGLYSDDLQRIGMVAEDSLRAARLVVDTGLHAKGWTRQQAIDYMVANIPGNLVDITVEVDRYLAMPGQALSYMVGRLEIHRLREWAAGQLGEQFAIAEFHDVLLGGGALPLGVLRELVADWVRDRTH